MTGEGGSCDGERGGGGWGGGSPDAAFEQVVVAAKALAKAIGRGLHGQDVTVPLQCKFRCRCDVVLSIAENMVSFEVLLGSPKSNKGVSTHVDSPELLHAIERHDFLKQIIPIVTLLP